MNAHDAGGYKKTVSALCSHLNGLNVTRHLLTIILASVLPAIIFQNQRVLTSLLTSRPGTWGDRPFLSASHTAVHSVSQHAFSTDRKINRGASSPIQRKKSKVSFSELLYQGVKLSLKQYIPSPGEHGEGGGEVAAGCAEALESFTKKNAQKNGVVTKHVREDVCLSVWISARSLALKRGETAS